MPDPTTSDIVFLEAIQAIDAGNLHALQSLLHAHPQLVADRFNNQQEGYFRNPWLLWFIANNPIRHEKMPANIAAITSFLIAAVQQNSPSSFQEQVDYTLGLVVTGRVVRECDVQIALMDLLIDAGALPGNGHAALANSNPAAAKHLLNRGGPLTLATAICLGMEKESELLLTTATATDREIALVAAAFYGDSDKVLHLIEAGVNVNAWLDTASGFHSHATALQQAVSSGSLETVSALVEAGADLTVKDRIFQGTALDWAVHMQLDNNDAVKRQSYAAIENYLRGIAGTNI